ncbi:CheY-like chemotaxis protein [Paraburkholderia atlantica]|uniref:CheY-like chemotaxis protein n=1 Tax=Paraburkholderia atlantica TaxID=2654982 RepID=A0A6I1Q2B6_PARAM|nr:response regulator [Paraburkholderia atlantica]MBB5428964.1 CheY-like chemotaxis protein [Paraburkholderia atlantica]MPW08438.1 response regulator [Paraburkholderia atlantica]NUY35314.1 response regulator [Paraburkholderia atlantica]
MQSQVTSNPVHILLVEDSPTDVLMTREALEDQEVLNPLHVVQDGAEAMDFLHRSGRHHDAPRPGLIILDLNLPKKSGREVLEELKADPDLLSIPVIVLTTSRSEEDVAKTYGLHANCCVTKPVDFTMFVDVLRRINDFWFSVVTLPPAKP